MKIIHFGEGVVVLGNPIGNYRIHFVFISMTLTNETPNLACAY